MGKCIWQRRLARTLVIVGFPFVTGVIMMLLGHVIGGLALFGGSILAATGAVVLASVTGVRHLRGVVRGMITEHDITEHDTTEHNSQVFQLDRDDYTYIG